MILAPFHGHSAVGKEKLQFVGYWFRKFFSNQVNFLLDRPTLNKHAQINIHLCICFNTFTYSSPVCTAQLISSTPLSGTSVHPRTRAFSVFLSSKSFGQRAFSSTGQIQWNSLPYEVWHSESSPAFTTALKTHLFRSRFWFFLRCGSSTMNSFVHSCWSLCV